VTWIVASFVFASLTLILGGPSQADSSQSVYSALLIAHGDVACAYPPAQFSHVGGFALTFASPVYTLLSAAGAWVGRIGHAVAFPSGEILGANCSHAMTQVSSWTQSGHILKDMLYLGFMGWLILLWGIVSLWRASGRGHDGWEAAVVLVIAGAAPVFSCIEAFFHPEDLVAVGFVLLAVANVFRERWWMVGVFLALAVLTQLFALLCVAPVLLAVGRPRLLRSLAGSIVTTLVVVGPLAVATSARVLHAVVLGTSRAGNQHVTGAGGTVLFAAGLHGFTLFLLSRVAPLAASVALSWYAWRRYGDGLREPTMLVSLVGACLALRLVFEVNAFGYYYMASVVFLVILDALRGRFRGGTFALIWLATLAYSPVAWGFQWRGNPDGPFLRALLPYVVAAPVLLIVAVDVIGRRRVRWYWAAWLVIVAIAFIRYPLPDHEVRAFVPSWLWQLILVPPLMLWLSGSLRGDRGPNGRPSHSMSPKVTSDRRFVGGSKPT